MSRAESACILRKRVISFIGIAYEATSMIENIIQDSNISSEEEEVVLYGLKRLEMLAVSIVATILIGSVTGELKGVMLFLIMFIPLRIFAGGLHMRKLWMCGTASSSLIILVALSIKYIEPEKKIISELLILCLVSAITIMALAPVDTESKRLFLHEKRKFKIISVIIVIVEIAVIFLPGLLPRVKMIAEISLVAESIYLVIQRLINLKAGRTETRE